MLFSRLSGFKTCFYNIILAIRGCPQFMPIFDDKDAYLCFRLCLSFRTKIGINISEKGPVILLFARKSVHLGTLNKQIWEL